MGTAGLGIAGAVRLRLARRGLVGQVPVEQGMVRNRRQGPSRRGFAGYVPVWLGIAGKAPSGVARRGPVWNRRRGKSACGADRFGEASQVRPVWVRSGQVCCGQVR